MTNGSTARDRSRRLFDEVVAVCGLSRIIGPGVVRRALSDGGVRDWRRASPIDFVIAADNIESRLVPYVGACEAAERGRRIKGLARLRTRA